MNYPKGSYIVRNDFRKRVIEEFGCIRFISPAAGSSPNWESKVEAFFTEDELKTAGWLVEIK